ncbi:MAG: CBS domain-containing protein, partial [Gemmatimonadaceae bacterium]|nr:CBS domain-containing protein [Gemmatimonadaceae bacterium]
PVIGENVDDVVGVVYLKDLIRRTQGTMDPKNGPRVEEIMRPPTFVPESKPVDELLRDMQAQRNHIAIVVDEYGGFAGLVTIEDILEEIVGEIRDEHDEEDAELERQGNDRFWVSGRLSLDELSEATRHDFREEDVTTVGGLVYARLGRVPRSGESFMLDGFRVVVERVVRRRIVRVYFERHAAPVRTSGGTRAEPAE